MNLVLSCSGSKNGLREHVTSGQADQGEGLNESDTQEHAGTQRTGHFRLPCHAFECLANQDADADAGANGGQAIADGGNIAVSSGFSGLRKDQLIHENVFPF